MIRQDPRTAVPPRRARAGFSLVSVIFAVVLLTLGMLALARSQTLLARTEGSTGIKNRAAIIARSHMEVLRSRPPATLASETGVVVDSLGRAVAGGGFTRSVNVEQVQTNLLRVTVSVAYPRGNVPADISTLIFR